MKKLVLSAVAISLLSGCTMMPQKDIRTLYVAPNTSPCVGGAPLTCLLTKENPDGKWQFFYDNIAGFNYEAGFRYKLSVVVTKVNNPPADASSLNWRLVKIEEKVADTTPAVINQ